VRGIPRREYRRTRFSSNFLLASIAQAPHGLFHFLAARLLDGKPVYTP